MSSFHNFLENATSGSTKHCVDSLHFTVLAILYTIRCHTTKYQFFQTYSNINFFNLFNLFGVPQKFKTLYFEETGPLLTASFTGYISIPIWITIIFFFRIEGASRQEIL